MTVYAYFRAVGSLSASLDVGMITIFYPQSSLFLPLLVCLILTKILDSHPNYWALNAGLYHIYRLSDSPVKHETVAQMAHLD